MYLFTFLVLLIIMLLILLAVYPLKLAASFSSEQTTDLHGRATWLNPLLKGILHRENKNIILTLYFFDKKFLSKDVTQKKANQGRRKSYTEYINYVRALKLEHVKLHAVYGFEDPSITGMICGGIDMFYQSINFEDFNVYADFNSEENHFNITGEAELNVIVSLFRILRMKAPNYHMPVLHVNK